MPVAVRASASTALNNIQMVDQGGAPTTPAAGLTRLYFTTDGIKWVDDAGAVNVALEVQGLTVKKTAGSVNLNINGAVATFRNLNFSTSGSTRWTLTINDDAEAGANEGASFSLNRYDDAGAYLATALGVNRATGNVTVGTSLEIDGDLNHDGSNIGVFGTAPTTKKTVTGSRGSNAALASLLTALAAYGLITDSSS